VHRHEEVSGVFDWEKHVFQDADPERRTVIGTLEDGTVVKGRAARGALECGLTYRFMGQWTTHPRFGRQFHFTSLTIAMPAGERATVRYLTKGPGIGSARAQRIWNLYRERSLEVMRSDPDLVAEEVEGLTPERAEAAAEYFRAHERLERVTIELEGLIGKRGFPRSLPEKLIRQWGEDAPRIVRQNPYLVMQFPGVGFLRADALYLELGHDPAAVARQAYCLWHAIASTGEGHTWYRLEDGRRALAQSISGAQLKLEEALILARENGLLTERADAAGCRWIAETAKAWAETRAAEYVHRAERESLASVAWWPDPATYMPLLSEHQQAEVTKAMGGFMGVLAGSPGTGKTFALAQIIRGIERIQGAARVAVCAPTGKAAVRATESLAKQSLSIQATTIHRLLGVVQAEGQGTRAEGWCFEHNEDNPLALDFLFVDEFSMCDTSLFASLLAARPDGCRVLLVGDPNQLAPVGHGAPLRDLIAAGLPSGHLQKIRRNAGRIVRSCAEIRDRHRIRFSPALELEGDEPENLVLVEQSEPAAQIAELEAFYARLDGSRYDPIWDVQVVVPVNDKSPLARKLLNKHLQGLLNPTGETVGGCPFREGDKIVCLKNGTLPLIEGDQNGSPQPGEAYVANGEQARVMELSERSFTARLETPARLVRVPRGRPHESEDGQPAAGCDFDLAYAISVHKSQGSEWPIVLVMLDGYGGARRVMTREWTYTAISRAKDYCVAIGRRNVADASCRTSGLWHRKTFLAEQIEAARLRLLKEAWNEDLSDEEDDKEDGQPDGRAESLSAPANGA